MEVDPSAGSATLLHIVTQHPGGLAIDYAVLAIGILCAAAAVVLFVLRATSVAQPQPQRSGRWSRPPVPDELALLPRLLLTRRATDSVSRAVAPRSLHATALSYLFLAVIAVQGFHVIEHVVLVIQVEAMGIPLAGANGLLGARVNFEWLHFVYNTSFLGVLALLLAYGGRLHGPARASRPVHLAVAGAVGLQTYHVFEHVTRIVQYLSSGCTPCVGFIGHVVLFIWPHLLFGVFAYAGLLAGYFGYGLHRHLALRLPPNPIVAVAEEPAS